jgi:hypothetical protein
MTLVIVDNISASTSMLAVSAVTGLAIAGCELSTAAGGNGPNIIFSYHIVSMGIAWPFLAFWGRWAYFTDGGSAKTDRRRRHMYLMLGTAAASIVGYYAIYKAHADNGEGQVGGIYFKNGSPYLSRSATRAIHVVVGYFVLIGSVVQVPIGIWKRQALESDTEPRRVAKWHGRFGSVLLLGGLAASTIGVWIHFSPKGGFLLWIKLALTVGLAAMVASIFLAEKPADSDEKQGDSDEKQDGSTGSRSEEAKEDSTEAKKDDEKGQEKKKESNDQ